MVIAVFSDAQGFQSVENKIGHRHFPMFPCLRGGFHVLAVDSGYAAAHFQSFPLEVHVIHPQRLGFSPSEGRRSRE